MHKNVVRMKYQFLYENSMRDRMLTDKGRISIAARIVTVSGVNELWSEGTILGDDFRSDNVCIAIRMTRINIMLKTQAATGIKNLHSVFQLISWDSCMR